MKHRSSGAPGEPSHQWIADYVQGVLSPENKIKLEKLMSEDARFCAEVQAVMDIRRQQEAEGLQPPPVSFPETGKRRIREYLKPGMCHVFADVADGVLQAVRTTGRLLVGPGLLTAQRMRSRGEGPQHTAVFETRAPGLLLRGELTVGENNRATLAIVLRGGRLRPASKHFRITLMDEDGERGSRDYSGQSVIFEDLHPGHYEVSVAENHAWRAGLALRLKDASCQM